MFWVSSLSRETLTDTNKFCVSGLWRKRQQQVPCYNFTACETARDMTIFWGCGERDIQHPESSSSETITNTACLESPCQIDKSGLTNLRCKVLLLQTVRQLNNTSRPHLCVPDFRTLLLFQEIHIPLFKVVQMDSRFFPHCTVTQHNRWKKSPPPDCMECKYHWTKSLSRDPETVVYYQYMVF